MGLFTPTFSAIKTATALKLCLARIKLLQNKKKAQVRGNCVGGTAPPFRRPRPPPRPSPAGPGPGAARAREPPQRTPAPPRPRSRSW